MLALDVSVILKPMPNQPAAHFFVFIIPAFDPDDSITFER